MAEEDLDRLRARNTAAKEQVDGLLDTFRRQTEALREAQEAASRASASLTSKDGLVRVSVDSSGALSALDLAPSAFDRSTPEALARTVLELARQGAAQVRQQVSDLMTPVSGGLPDFGDLFDDAPSLRGLMADIPVPTATAAAEPRVDDDEAPDSWLRRR
ncbi:YbaB/EbfC family nucleoid-associated protein [Actinokineospora pegani]|uniref:YbaB/EbfC family nucleoid-associated protein n=1 Tax=Actinokineospora pegani TaxID=2654637 RepID=UPI0012EAE3A8|nr:YbaB/EbfC family nucleoid-associated protein [Actinokineospora pegani]